MHITVTARHCDIPDELRGRATALLQRLGRVASRPHDGQVIFGADHATPRVEVRLHTARSRVYVASAGAPDHRTALDRAVAKLRRQLDKPIRRALEREPR